MRDREEEIERSGAGIAAIGLGGRTYAAAFREETGIDFPLLIDERRVAYDAAGLRSGGILELLRPFNLAARARAGREGHRQHRIGKDPFQLGGTFVLAPGDRDWFAHRSGTFGDVAEIDAVLAALARNR
ncbi:MAG TPA: peroxiredoxin-like family protein [Candidatus Eisenbacteria bacterium]